MAKNKWFKFFPSDFLAGIHNLEQIEVTAYIVAICEMYDKEGSCPRDDAVMSRRCRMRKAVFTKALDGLIAKGKIDFYAGQLTNKRVSDEIESRTRAALEKAQLRHGHDTATTQPRLEQAKKNNRNNENPENVRAYKEERIKITPSSEVYTMPPRELSAADRSQRALEEFQKRKRQRQGKPH